MMQIFQTPPSHNHLLRVCVTLLCATLWLVPGCGEDPTVFECTLEKVSATCPAGTTAKQDPQTQSLCQSLSNGAPVTNAEGAVFAVCGGESQCRGVCELSSPCECGVASSSAEGVVCAECPVICGDGLCETDRNEDSVSCNSDCKESCAFGSQRCVGDARQTCEDGFFVNAPCSTNEACRPITPGKTCERDTDCAQGQFCDQVSALLLGKCSGDATACLNPACQPQCVNLACGDDGCGGQCGTCDPGHRCTPARQCEPTTSFLAAAHLQFDLTRFDMTLITGELLWAGVSYLSTRDFATIEIPSPIVELHEANTANPGSGDLLRTGSTPAPLTVSRYHVLLPYDGRFYLLNLRPQDELPSAPSAEIRLFSTTPFADFTFSISDTPLTPVPLSIDRNLIDGPGVAVQGDVSLSLSVLGGPQDDQGQFAYDLSCPLRIPSGQVGYTFIVGALDGVAQLAPKAAVLVRDRDSNRLTITTSDCAANP